MKDRYDRSVCLECPTCGGSNFQQGDAEQVTCFQCGHTLTKDELRIANASLVEAKLEELKSEALRDAQADLKKMFSKWK